MHMLKYLKHPSGMPLHKRIWRKRHTLWAALLEDQLLQGYGGPPNAWRSKLWTLEDVDVLKEVCGRPVHIQARHDLGLEFCNDAMDVQIVSFWQEGGRESYEVHVQIPRWVFQRMILWYLWRWVWGEWFGLRRRLYYRRLRRRVQHFTPHLRKGASDDQSDGEGRSEGR